jgi:putative DNA methylase
MPDDGMQVVMFVHQDPEIWADVGLTLWAAGLQVQSAWTVVTETPTAGIRGGGNYVQGTVNLVLRKRIGGKRGDLADLFPEIQDEVRQQIEEMQNLDDMTDPNFGDADLQLAAYAASLRVLTGYVEIKEIDVERELRRTRARGEESPLARLIRQAVRIASDYLVPRGLEPATWRKLSPEERLYLKGIETEAGGEAREGVYQELARGFGAGPHRELYASRAANRVRFKTPTEFGSRDLRRIGEEGFAGSTLRQMLHAVSSVAAHAERDPRPARVSLRAALPNYWTERERLADLLVWLSDRASVLSH